MLVLTAINLQTKSEMSSFIHCKDMKKVKIIADLWWLESLKVIGNVTIQYSTCDFLLPFIETTSVLRCLLDTAN